MCGSTNTGELLSYVESHDTALSSQQLWYELTGFRIPIELVIDSNGTSDNVTSTRLPTEKRSRSDMARLRQGLHRAEYVVSWVSGRANLSDIITKEILGKGRSPKFLRHRLKQPLLVALRSSNAKIKGVLRLTKSQRDVSR